METNKYRIWYGNGDLQIEPLSIPEAVDDVESEMQMTASIVLVTRGDLNKEETLKEVDILRDLIVCGWKEKENQAEKKEDKDKSRDCAQQ